VSYTDSRAASTVFVVLRAVRGERRDARCLAKARDARSAWLWKSGLYGVY
jgi:hypothetical protein